MPLSRHSPPIGKDSPDDFPEVSKPSIVRFRLPLTPPQGTEMPPKSMLYRDVGTNDSFAEVPKVNRSASKWTKADLGLLSVNYQYNKFDDIQIADTDMPSELLELIETYARRIAAIDMSVLKPPDSDPEILEMLRGLEILEFGSTYLSLAKLLARLRRSTHAPIAFATPPGQTTLPEDPDHSGGSTSTSSGSSTESKPEPYAQNVATDLLKGTYSTVVKWMRRFEWVNPDARLYLSPHALEKMEIRLGKVQLVKAIDDGGISMYFRRDPSSTQQSRRVILSVEAKRKKHAKESDEDTANRHAAQIYAEMLGQVCHPEFYNVMDNGYQESFVIHIRHATIYLFYAKFPNQYLAQISEHGANYSKRFPHEKNVRLCQSRPYMMKKAEDQAAFYRLLAILLWYLASGKSHVGYLCNCPRNPFVAKPPRAVHDCVVVQPLTDMSIDLEGDFMGSDMAMDDPDDDDRLEERMEGC